MGHGRQLGPETGGEVRNGTFTSLRAFLFYVSVNLRVQMSKADRSTLTGQSSEGQRSKLKVASVLEGRDGLIVAQAPTLTYSVAHSPSLSLSGLPLSCHLCEEKVLH